MFESTSTSSSHLTDVCGCESGWSCCQNGEPSKSKESLESKYSSPPGNKHINFLLLKNWVIASVSGEWKRAGISPSVNAVNPSGLYETAIVLSPRERKLMKHPGKQRRSICRFAR